MGINESIKPGASERETKWISEEDIKTEAISTAMKKVFALFRKSENLPNKKVRFFLYCFLFT